MKKSLFVILLPLLIFSFLLPPNSHARWNDLSKIVSPNWFAELNSYPVEIVVQLKDRAKEETFKAWLNGKNITDKFVYDGTENKLTATVGPDDGLKIMEKGERRWWRKTNILKTKVRGPKRRIDIDTRPFYVKVDAMATIGPEGGVLKVTNPKSPIYGTKVEILNGSLEEAAIISIFSSQEAPDLPEGVSSNGPSIEIQCSVTSEFQKPVVVYIPVNENPLQDEYLDTLYYNENTSQWEKVTSWYAYEEQKMVFFTKHFSLYQPVRKRIPNVETEVFTQFNMDTDTMEYENNNFSYCPQYSDGVCAGMAYFTEWYFENKGHGLRCYYDLDTGQQVSCEAYQEFRESWLSFLVGFSYIPQLVDNASTKYALQFAINSGNPKALSMISLQGKGHAIVAYGWTPIDIFGNGYFTCYDVNDNSTPIRVYAIGINLSGYNPIIMYVENQPEWNIFGVWSKWGQDIESIYNKYGPTFNDDPDNDLIGDNCDNCPNDYNLDQTDSDGDGIGDLCDCHEADTDCDGCIEINELIDYIARWKAGEVSIDELINAIGIWKSCTPNSLSNWPYIRRDLAGTSNQPYGSKIDTSLNLTEQFNIPGIPTGTILTGDVDNDGKLEIVHVAGNLLRIFDENGDLKIPSVTLGSSSCHLSMLADVNGDGVLDIGIGTGEASSLKAYFYDGNGNLLHTLSRSAGYDSYMFPYAILENGKCLITLNAGYSHDNKNRGWAVYDLNTQDEIWNFRIGPFAWLASVADINNDGKYEITSASGTPHNGCCADGYNHNGTTTCDGDLWLIVVDEDGNQEIAKIYPGDGVVGHIFVDLNNDEEMEILGFEGHGPVYYHGDNQIHLFDRYGNTLYTFDGPYDGGAWTYAIADIDSNGKSEVVTSAGYGGNNKTFVLNDKLEKIDEIQGEGFVQLIADLNGDFVDDIVLISENGTIKVLDNELQMIDSYYIGGEFGFAAHSTPYIIASDIDDDGILELICRNDDGIHVLEFAQ